MCAMRGTSWWLSDRYFTEHPAKKAGRADEAKWGDKWRVYCTNCLAHHITEIQQKNNIAERMGEPLVFPRDQAGIEAYCTIFSFYYKYIQKSIGTTYYYSVVIFCKPESRCTWVPTKCKRNPPKPPY